jgi:hypothetical protein
MLPLIELLPPGMFSPRGTLPEQYPGNQPVLPSGDMGIKAYRDAVHVAFTGVFNKHARSLPTRRGRISCRRFDLVALPKDAFLFSIAAVCGCLSTFAAATILENGQVRLNLYPGQAPTVELDDTWRVYDPGAKEISYKGRWDSQHISWWSAPGFKLGFSGSRLAVSFGQHTSPGVLVAYRYGGQPWQFSNVRTAYADSRWKGRHWDHKH